MMKRFHFLAALLGVFVMFAVVTPSPVEAQFSSSYEFLKAVKERDGDKVKTLLEKSASTLVNTRDLAKGETALHIVVARRDVAWTRFLLAKGANPNARDKNNVTPLLLAARYRDVDIAEVLLRRKANVNGSNSSGETPLIIAVQLSDLPMVRLLLKKGADPDQTDNIAGKSARDYAMESRQATALLEVIDAEGKDTKKEDVQIFGPTL
ncbi:ankyrin repeat domain-containing protein [Sphingorhabdus sp. Alg239-R122]|uniref:ankyrin repeat domain-containing protein n=1 Tax=Sphingorhabdus sp. Alg239-R122 TaxID=2305989 RepID=UPI0013DA2DE8|nr:ankyrin repeat domain-containing protein [Sphingorhabdus sp. Alg239-R122]